MALVFCPGGEAVLSRRDRMNVARQFTAWNMLEKKRPVP